ncbi:MAG TPA: chloride channel protein [Gaiellales bacterium]|jgi:H+/Cl- antiporter ClcA|nr:chloride channel protein [Gaiellales bacterium]
MTNEPPSQAPAQPVDPLTVVRTPAYLQLLALAAILGAPIAIIAWGFLWLVNRLQTQVFTDLPGHLGFDTVPVWWPLPLLALSGVLTALAILHLPGHGGHSPADGFQARGHPQVRDLPGVALAALATLSLGVVLGPEAPLIALGGGLALIAVSRRKVDARTEAVVASTGSFASISTLFGNPILAAFMLMEAAGLGGPALDLILVPGLLAAGIGALIFTGLDSWTGVGPFSLVIPNVPHTGSPTLAEFGWAIVIGLVAAVAAGAIRSLALAARPHIERRMLSLMPVVGVAVGGLAILYHELSGRNSTEVLFSGQAALGPLIQHNADYTIGALLALVLCKSLAYGLSLSCFRGGPVFPSMFVGAAGGVALSHLPGLPVVPAVAMGIGAMCAAMLGLPLTSVMLATLLLLSDGLTVMPLVIVAVAVAYVARARLTPPASSAAAPAAAPESHPVGTT